MDIENGRDESTEQTVKEKRASRTREYEVKAARELNRISNRGQ